MLANTNRHVFVYPALLMLALLCILGINEYKMEVYKNEVVFIMNGEVPRYSRNLLDNYHLVLEELDNYIANPSLEQERKIDALYYDARKYLDKIETYITRDSRELEEHKRDLQLLPIIRTQIDEIEKQLPLIGSSDQNTLKSLKKTLTKLTHDIHNYSTDVNKSHETAVHQLAEHIEYLSLQRIFFITITLASFGFILISLYKNAETCRKESNIAKTAERRSSLFVSVLQSADVGVMVRDVQLPNNPVVFINKALTKLTGYEFEDVAGKPIGFLVGLHTDQNAIRTIWDAFHNSQSTSIELIIYRKDGTSFWCQWQLGPVLQKDGTVSHFVSIITDISSIRSTQESLLLAKEEAERAVGVKGHFLASMSHELRTPINGMLGVMNLLLDTSLDSEQNKLVQIAQTSGQRLLEIINDILDYSKIEAGKLDVEANPFSLKILVNEVVDLMSPVASSKGLPLVVSIVEGTPDSLMSDSGRIRQILLNLVGNAIKFTEQGAITIRIFSLMDQSDHLQNLTLMRFEVIDSGIGIGVADQEKLFNEFTQVERTFTRRYDGTGLGLAICKQLVKLLTGEIGVESRLGQGSRFWFMLPIQLTNSDAVDAANKRMVGSQVRTLPAAQPIQALPAQQQQQAEVKVPFIAQTNEETDVYILLAEDNQVNQLVASRYLQKAGYHVDVANNGVEAVEKIKEKNYHAILMDVSMPEMDGFAATRQIRSMGGIYAAIPIIALTAHVMRGDREHCLASGMNDYLSKPLQYETLCKALQHWAPQPSAPAPTIKEKTAMPNSIPQNDEIPVFDAGVLKQLEQDLDAQMVANITQVFLDDFARRTIILKDKLTTFSVSDIVHEAHALKSSSAGCGLLQFSNLMRLMEEAGNNNDRVKIQILADRIERVYDASRTALIEGRKPYTA